MWYEVNLPMFLLGCFIAIPAIVGVVAFLIDFFTGDDE